MAFDGSYSNSEIQNISELAGSKYRKDKRTFSEFRKFEIDVNRDFKSVTIAYGGTRLMARISYDIVTPLDSSPIEGILKFNISHDKTVYRSNTEFYDINSAVSLAIRYLERCFKEARVIDLESLCIIRNKKVFKLNINIDFICLDGGLFDSACIAVVTLLKMFRKPQISVNGDQILIHNFNERAPSKLCLFQVPMLFQIGFDSESGDVLMDLTQIELDYITDGSFIVGITSDDELVCLYYTQGKFRRDVYETLNGIKSMLMEQLDVRLDFIDKIISQYGCNVINEASHKYSTKPKY